MEIFKGQNLLEFSDRFKSDLSCKEYLSELKWEKGYKCVKCGHKLSQQRKDFSRTCNRCSRLESSTANTLFHKVKFGLRKAFFICFEMGTTTKSLSASYMSVRQIDNFSAKELKIIFQHHISKDTLVRTDGWRGYLPIMKKGYKIEQEQSEGGKNFKILHTMIHQVKSWIRTTYCWVSDHHVQRYYNEFCYRLNRSQTKDTIFNNLIKRMVKSDKIYHQDLICS